MFSHLLRFIEQLICSHADLPKMIRATEAGWCQLMLRLTTSDRDLFFFFCSMFKADVLAVWATWGRNVSGNDDDNICVRQAAGV